MKILRRFLAKSPQREKITFKNPILVSWLFDRDNPEPLLHDLGFLQNQVAELRIHKYIAMKL